MSESPSIPITLRVATAKVHNAIIGALESGSLNWLRGIELKEGFTKSDDALVWWGHQKVFSQPFKAEVSFDDPAKEEGNGEGRRTISNSDLQRALTQMAEKSPAHFADLVRENDDGITHDVFMQYLVLDDVIYG